MNCGDIVQDIHQRPTPRYTPKAYTNLNLCTITMSRDNIKYRK